MNINFVKFKSNKKGTNDDERRGKHNKPKRPRSIKYAFIDQENGVSDKWSQIGEPA